MSSLQVPQTKKKAILHFMREWSVRQTKQRNELTSKRNYITNFFFLYNKLFCTHKLKQLTIIKSMATEALNKALDWALRMIFRISGSMRWNIARIILRFFLFFSFLSLFSVSYPIVSFQFNIKMNITGFFSPIVLSHQERRILTMYKFYLLRFSVFLYPFFFYTFIFIAFYFHFIQWCWISSFNLSAHIEHCSIFIIKHKMPSTFNSFIAQLNLWRVYSPSKPKTKKKTLIAQNKPHWLSSRLFIYRFSFLPFFSIKIYIIISYIERKKKIKIMWKRKRILLQNYFHSLGHTQKNEERREDRKKKNKRTHWKENIKCKKIYERKIGNTQHKWMVYV